MKKRQRRRRWAVQAVEGHVAKRKRSRFQILDVHSRAKEAFDEVGVVRVYVRLVDKHGRLVKGNVARSVTIAAARVLDVFQVVRAAVEDA